MKGGCILKSNYEDVIKAKSEGTLTKGSWHTEEVDGQRLEGSGTWVSKILAAGMSHATSLEVAAVNIVKGHMT